MESAADRASDLLKALSNRHRLLIICQLIDGERSVGDLAEFLDLRDSDGVPASGSPAQGWPGVCAARRPDDLLLNRQRSRARSPEDALSGVLRAAESHESEEQAMSAQAGEALRQVNVPTRNFNEMLRQTPQCGRRDKMVDRSMRRLMALSLAVAAVLRAASADAETLTVAPRSVADEKAVFATVESISVVPARGRIGGTIVQLNVREGDAVTRGQAIAAIGDEKLASPDEIAGCTDRRPAGAIEPGANRFYPNRGTGGARHASSNQA